MSLFQDLVRERITPKPVPTPTQPAKPVKQYKNVLEYNRDNFMPKKESNLLTKAGQFMQKMPDTTLKSNVKFNQNPLVAAQGKVGEFISGLPGEMIRETGKAFELVSTKQGRGEIKKGIQDYPQEFKKLATPGQRLEGADALLKNPATLTAFGLTNIPSPKNLVKKGVQEFVEQGAKKVVKEGTEELVEQGAKKIVKEGVEEFTEQGAKKVIKNIGPNIGTTIKPKLLTAGDPEQRAVEAIKMMSPLRKEQEALYTAGRSQKIQKALEAEKQAGGGVAGFSAKMKQMEGSFDKVTHSSIRSQVSQSDIDMLVNKINNSPALTDFEKIPAQKALLNLFGDEGAKIPTESELNKLRQVFKPELVDELLKQRSFGDKAKSLVTDVLNIPRAIMSSGDFSAPLRQGVFAASSHPKDFARSFKKMFEYAFSQKKYEELYKGIAKRPTYTKMRDYGLAITDMGSHTTREEAFMSNLAEKIPIVGRLVRASDRAYTGFLTNFRADLFDTLYKNGEVLGKANDERYLKSLTSFINTATGRGNLKEIPLVGEQLSEAAPLLNGLFFSPRLIASRVNLLNPVYYAKLEPTVRKEAVKSLVTFTTTGMTILGTAALAGADVETDPTSADFGKIRIGNTRYDIWGGFQPYATFTARMILGRQKSTTTGGTFKYGEGYKPTTRKDVAYRFAEGKASPIASFGMDALVGKDFEGNKFDLTNPDLTVNPLTKRMSPLVISDMKDAIKEYGEMGIVIQIPGLFGVNTQTYKKKPYVSKSTSKSRAGTSL